MRIETELVQLPDAASADPYRASSPPLYQTATFRKLGAVASGRFDYTRSGNPTRELVELQLARLERGASASCFSSGMAAIAAVCSLAGSGASVIAGSDLYGGTYRYLHQVLARQGVQVLEVDMTDAGAVARALAAATAPALLLVESPSNPLLRVADLRALAALCRRHGTLLAVDNSLLSPVLQRPLELGADLVIHSATKFLCGHNDVTAGAVVAAAPALAERIAFYQNAAGNGLAPFEAWLLLRGMRTLGLRLARQQENAAGLARLLVSDRRVRRVHYPGAPGHPDRSLLEQQADGAGAVLAFETGDVELSRRIAEATQLFSIRVSFGGLDSSLSLPAFMSHASIPEAVRRAHRLPEDLVRVSAGIEDLGNLERDITQALERAEKEVGA